MRELTFYEQLGILLPGTVLLFGVSLVAPEVKQAVSGEGSITVGGLGLFLIIAYALGHLVAAIGNMLEGLLWSFTGGMPASWVRDPKRVRLLTPSQHQALLTKVNSRYATNLSAIRGLSPSEWRGLFSRLYHDVLAEAPTARLDVMLATYGLNRGLATVSLMLLMTIVVQQPPQWQWFALGVTSACFGYGFRTVRFGLYWARELYAVYLALPDDRLLTNPPNPTGK